MNRYQIPHNEPQTEVFYRNSKPLTKKQQGNARDIATQQGMQLVPWGKQNQYWIVPAGTKLCSGVPHPTDIYGIIGSNYVRVINMLPENDESRRTDRSELASALKKALE